MSSSKCCFLTSRFLQRQVRWCFTTSSGSALLVNRKLRVTECVMSTKASVWAVLYLVAQLCLTLCDLMDCSPPGSSVYGDSTGKNTGGGCHALLWGIFPTQVSNPGLPRYIWILYHLSHQGSPRVLEWVAEPFSGGSSWPRDQTRVSCIDRQILYCWATKRYPGSRVISHTQNELLTESYTDAGQHNSRCLITWGEIWTKEISQLLSPFEKFPPLIILNTKLLSLSLGWKI